MTQHHLLVRTRCKAGIPRDLKDKVVQLLIAALVRNLLDLRGITDPLRIKAYVPNPSKSCLRHPLPVKHFLLKNFERPLNKQLVNVLLTKGVTEQCLPRPLLKHEVVMIQALHLPNLGDDPAHLPRVLGLEMRAWRVVAAVIAHVQTRGVATAMTNGRKENIARTYATTQRLLDDETMYLILEANVVDGIERRFERGTEIEMGREIGSEIAQGIDMETESGIVTGNAPTETENVTGIGIGTKLRRRGTETATETAIGTVGMRRTVTVTARKNEMPQAVEPYLFPPRP
jgi:hypothetical protein